MEIAHVPSIHPLWTLCLIAEFGSQRLISVGEENIRDSLFRKKGKAAHFLHTVKVISPAIASPPRAHIRKELSRMCGCRLVLCCCSHGGFLYVFVCLHTDVGRCVQGRISAFHYGNIIAV